MTELEIAEIISAIEDRYDLRFDADRLDRWTRALDDQDPDQILEALAEYLETGDKWPPKPADLIRIGATIARRPIADGVTRPRRPRSQIRATSRRRIAELDRLIERAKAEEWPADRLRRAMRESRSEAPMM